MSDPYASIARPVDPYASIAQPASRPAGLPAGVDLPQPAAHPAVTMNAPQTIQGSFEENTRTNPNEPLLETGLKSTVGTIGQPFVHPVDTVVGMGRMLLHPQQQADEEVSNLYAHPAYEGTKLAGSLLGNAALGAAGGGALGEVGELIPTKAKAGAIFEDLNKNLANQPVRLNQAVAPLQRATEIGARGGSLPPSVSSLLQRSQSPIEMTFPEARDYQGSLSDLSASDKLAMNGRMRGGVAQLNKGLYQDIRDAAEQQGRGADFDKAMRDYGRAATIQDGLQWAKDHSIPLLVGGGAASVLAKKLLPGK